MVGEYTKVFNDILNLQIKPQKIYQSPGLKIHMKKHNHKDCLKYYDKISEIINKPDYIGINPNEKMESIELVKRYEDNVLVGIKLDKEEDYLYVSTMHDIQEPKIQRRLHSGRLKQFSVDDIDKKK